MVNATNTEFLRGLQEATLGVIVTTIQQRQGINVQGDTSHTTQTPETQEGTATPAEEPEETPAEPEPIEELVQTEEPAPEGLAPVELLLREHHRQTGETLGQEAETEDEEVNTQQNHHQYLQDHQIDCHLDHHHNTWSVHRGPPLPLPLESPPGSNNDQTLSERDVTDDEGHEEGDEAQGPEAHRKIGEHLQMQVQDMTSGYWTEQNGEKGPHGQEPQEKQQRKIVTQNSTNAYTAA